MKYVFGFAACFGVIAACAHFGVEVGLGVSVLAVLAAMMVSSRFK